MAEIISSRTPEGEPNQCPVCGKIVCIEPSQRAGDAPCPHCGTLLWFIETSTGMRFYDSKAIAPLKEKFVQAMRRVRGLVNPTPIVSASKLWEDIRNDSLNTVELVMELEEEFDIPISDEEAEQIKTVGDAIDFLEKYHRQQNEPEA